MCDMIRTTGKAGNVSCDLSRNFLRHKLHEKLTSVTYPATDHSRPQCLRFLAVMRRRALESRMATDVSRNVFLAACATDENDCGNAATIFSNIVPCNTPRNDSCNLYRNDLCSSAKRSSDSRESSGGHCETTCKLQESLHSVTVTPSLTTL